VTAKAILRRKKQTVRVEEAGAIAERIGQSVPSEHTTGSENMWAAVRKFTGRRQRAGVVDAVSAESLSEHYAKISTDDIYAVPLCKQSEHVTEWCVFQALDNLRPTDTGLDELPA